MAIDRDKYRRMFIEEAKEGLRALDNDLVSLERLEDNAAAAEKKKQVMDAAFRTAHSLKGMGAAMGYGRFAELAHRLEDLADLARQGRPIGTEGFDLLLEGCDRLTEMVASVAAGNEDPDAGDLTARVQGFLGVTRANTAPPESTPPTTAQEAVTTVPRAAAAEGAALFVKVRIAEGASLPQVRAFVVYKALSQLTGFRDSDPSPEVLRTRELPDRTLTLRFESGADIQEIERIARGAQGVAEVEFLERAHKPRPEETAPAEADKKDRGGDEDRTVRVRTQLLDEFIDSVGELLLARSRMKALAVRMDVPELFDLVDEVDRLTRELNARVVAARMTPLAFLAERLPRVVRDLARQQGKSVDFQMAGTDIELDRAILDELSTPFLHMMRNSVDHAHEGPDERKKTGKAATMKLSLTASRDRDNVLLEIVDDGRGIDAARVRAKAVERGLLSPSAAASLSDAAALDLICLPGFSTAEAVSQTSGRGVGMDVVKATLERLGGTLAIQSTAGVGTRFLITLPLTVAIIQVLVIEAGSPEDAYAIPVNRVERAVDLDPAAVSIAHGRTWLRLGEDLVPLTSLAQELGHNSAGGNTVIVVGRGAETAALRVDRIVGQEEVVAKPLGAPLATLPFLAGAALLADGRAAFVLEPLRIARGDGSRAETPAASRAATDSTRPTVQR